MARCGQNEMRLNPDLHQHHHFVLCWVSQQDFCGSTSRLESALEWLMPDLSLIYLQLESAALASPSSTTQSNKRKNTFGFSEILAIGLSPTDSHGDYTGCQGHIQYKGALERNLKRE